jgi:hypothetical protein
MWLTIAASCAAGAAAFLTLYRLRDDPLPSLGATFRIAAFLQPIPFAAAAILAVCLRRRPEILGYSLAAVIGGGSFGWWWLSGLAELRRIENEPVRRGALGNILPDIEGQVGSVKALLWPVAVVVIIGGLTLIGWAASRRTRGVLERGTRPNGSEPS